MMSKTAKKIKAVRKKLKKWKKGGRAVYNESVELTQELLPVTKAKRIDYIEPSDSRYDPFGLESWRRVRKSKKKTKKLASGWKVGY